MRCFNNLLSNLAKDGLNHQLRLSTPWSHWPPTSLPHWSLLTGCCIYTLMLFERRPSGGRFTEIFTEIWRLHLDNMWLIILKHLGIIWILVLFTWEPWLFVLCNQLSIYSVFHHSAVTGDVVVIYCRWQLTAEHKVQHFESLCVVSLAAQHKSCIFYFIISKPLYCSLDSNYE